MAIKLNCLSSELLYCKSNRPQVSMVCRLINHLGCLKNTQKITNSYHTFCSANIPHGLSAFKPKKLGLTIA